MIDLSPPVRVDVAAGGGADDRAYALLDVRAPAGTLLPPHAASREDGVLVVLSGRVEVVMAGRRRIVATGGMIALPRATPRRLEVLEDARLLCLAVPAGIELLAGLVQPPVPDPDDRAVLLAAAGIDVLPVAWGASGR